MTRNNIEPHETTVAVAMSGGVDSTVTAALLKNKGYSVRGVFMALGQPDLERQMERVRAIAARLDIPFAVMDLGKPFRGAVLDYFRQSYLAGKTPNPCIVCNREIKFGKLQEKILQSADMMATGHYARIVYDSALGFGLFKGRDAKKDQSYFLCRLTQQHLAKILFPLGELSKDEVYGRAHDLGFTDFQKSGESQDVCFLKGGTVHDFFARQQVGTRRGEIVTSTGQVIGWHAGIQGYTVGQRRGLGIPDATPYYVVALDSLRNRVVVGKKSDLWRDRLMVRDMNWISGHPPELPGYFAVKIRYRHEPAGARVETAGAGRLIVHFDQAQRAITPGQFAVLYSDDEVIGGGEIVKAFSR